MSTCAAAPNGEAITAKPKAPSSAVASSGACSFRNGRDGVHPARLVVGLALNPPDRALTLSADERSQTPAQKPTERWLSVSAGQVEHPTHG